MNTLILALPAPDEAPSSPGGDGAGLFGWPFLLMMVAVFWLFIIRPASKREKDRRELLKGLKKHDKVVTSGGIYGVVTSIEDDVITLEVAQGVRMRFSKSAIQSVDRPVDGRTAESAGGKKKAEAKS